MLCLTKLAFHLPLESHPYDYTAYVGFGRQYQPRNRAVKKTCLAFLCCNSELIKKPQTTKVSESSWCLVFAVCPELL